MSFTAFLGFSFTYFGPMARGEYPEVSPTVHVHGWSFFIWYLLLPLQAGLIRTRRFHIHRTLGLTSLVLAAIMVSTGVVVVGVQMELALAPDGSPFWIFMTLPIASLLLLFTVFYVAAILRRRVGADHKRLMILASAAALSAATFRILVRILGFEQWVWIVGFSLPVLFVLAAIIYDYLHGNALHRVYRWGVPIMIGIPGVLFVLASTSGGEVLKHGLAWVGRALAPLY